MSLCIDTLPTNNKANLTMTIVSRDFSINDVDSTLSSLDDIQNLEKKNTHKYIESHKVWSGVFFPWCMYVC